MVKLSKTEKDEILKYFNYGLVPSEEYNPAEEYPLDWFKRYFAFLSDEKLSAHLGEAFYQARYCSNVVRVLSLTHAKHKIFTNMQIIQYASICEALLQKTIEEFCKEEFQERYPIIELRKCPNALSNSTKIEFEKKPAILCIEKKTKADVKRERMPRKTEFAVSKGIISEDSKTKFDALYDTRNNVHLLKATQNDYSPRKIDAQNAFDLMEQIVGEIKVFYIENNKIAQRELEGTKWKEKN